MQIAELSKMSDFPPINSTPVSTTSRSKNIYELYLGKHPVGETYWTDWGGFYDNPIVLRPELYFERFLTTMNSFEDMLSQENTLYFDIKTKTAYFNIPRHPWLYDENENATLRIVSGFLSGPTDPTNPMSVILEGEYLPAIIGTPSVSAKLSSPISGITKSGTFDISIQNDDGRFDDDMTLLQRYDLIPQTSTGHPANQLCTRPASLNHNTHLRACSKSI